MTRRQRDVVDFIDEYCRQHGFSPTVREITFGIGLSSASTVMSHLTLLERDGRITRQPGCPRSIRVVTS